MVYRAFVELLEMLTIAVGVQLRSSIEVDVLQTQIQKLR
jgi:hypothetical protein